MNERIRELYNQCFVVLENQSPNTGFDFEKFAELIVRECIDIAYREGDNVAYLALHFGIEE